MVAACKNTLEYLSSVNKSSERHSLDGIMNTNFSYRIVLKRNRYLILEDKGKIHIIFTIFLNL